ncbi:MAG: hypothetical protein NTW19_06770 [Planctomycetota bacterium]|nr:hypothetical protein [Planctomycetota bacterium]
MSDISAASSADGLGFQVAMTVAAKSQSVAKQQGQAAIALLDSAVQLAQQQVAPAAGGSGIGSASVGSFAGRRLDVKG